MLIGYARTSTIDQVAGLDAQIRDLRAAGVEELFQEQVSSVAEDRPELARMLAFIRRGDILVVTKLDRLARSVADLMSLLNHLTAKGADLRIMNLGVDTSTPTGKLMLTVLAGVGQFEREIMLERQREGIAKAQAEGKYQGRKASIDRAEVARLAAEGLGDSEIGRRLGASRVSVWRIRQELSGAGH